MLIRLGFTEIRVKSTIVDVDKCHLFASLFLAVREDCPFLFLFYIFLDIICKPNKIVI
jgi:hypothetical protein